MNRCLALLLLAACSEAPAPELAPEAPRLCRGEGTVEGPDGLEATGEWIIDEARFIERIGYFPVEGEPWVEQTVHDAAWQPLTGWFDEDGDGDPDAAYQFERDAAGRELAQYVDDDGDGTPDWWITWAYDDEGRLVERAHHGFDSDGAPLVGTYRYVYEGALLVRVELDYDGVHHEITTYAYDEHDRVILLEARTPDGALLRTWTWTWLGGPSSPDVVIRREYAAEWLTDLEQLYLHDEAGRVEHTESTVLDPENPWVTVTDFAYDARGNEIYRRTDDNGSLTTTHRAYEEVTGLLLEGRVEQDPDGDGTVDDFGVEQWLWDCRAVVDASEVVDPGAVAGAPDR